MSDGSIWIFGAGGHGKVALATAQAAGLSIAGMLDNDSNKTGQSLLGVPIGPVPGAPWWASEHRRVLLAIGANGRRADLAQSLPARWATVIHPSAIVHPSAEIGEGTLICAGAIIQPDVRIGKHVIVNTGAIVDHDCRIEDCVHLAPGTTCAGNVTIGARVFLGAGAVVIPGMEIGPDSIVGAGAVVIRPLEAGITAAGVPARRLASRKDAG